MPYIEQNRRDEIDEIIKALVAVNVKADGDLNYVLYKFCKYCVPKSYNSLKNYIAELDKCGKEIERRILADYEDEKIIQNGDV